MDDKLLPQPLHRHRWPQCSPQTAPGRSQKWRCVPLHQELHPYADAEYRSAWRPGMHITPHSTTPERGVLHHRSCGLPSTEGSRGTKPLDRLTLSITLLKAMYQNCGIIVCWDFNKAAISRIEDKQLVNVVKQPTPWKELPGLNFHNSEQILPPDHNSAAHRRVRSQHRHVKAKRPSPVDGSPSHNNGEKINARLCHQKLGQWITSYDCRPVLDVLNTQ